MTRTISAVGVMACVMHAASITPAHAQTEAPDDLAASRDAPKWVLGVGVAVMNADVRVVDSQASVPEDLQVGDFDLELADTLSISATSLSARIGYRLLPFLNVSAQGGLVWSDTQTGVTLSGTPDGVFSNLVSGPISVDADLETDASGYSLGLAANAFAPIASIRSKTVVLTSGFTYVWNTLENGDVQTEATRTSVGLVYPVSADPRSVVYRLSGSYNWLTREIERSVALGQGDVAVSITQEYDDPWSAEFGASIPVSERVRFGISASQQIGGETSGFASVIVQL